MSADNLAICPMCRADIETDPLVPFDENEDNYTVCEYYDLVLNIDGTLSIWYSGICKNCGAEWRYINENISCKSADL